MSRPEEPPPNEPTRLAAIAAHQAQPPEEREDAFRQLRPYNVRFARAVAQARGRRKSDDLVDDLVSHVESALWSGQFDPARSSYPTWCRRVMGNRLIDFLRKESRTVPLSEELLQEQSSADWQASLAGSLDWHEPFTSADLEKITAWPNPLRRIVLLCRSNLWHKVPDSTWQSWTEEYGLPWPFPPEGFSALAPVEQTRLLANLLGLTRNDVNQHWHRGLGWLREIHFVKGLIP